jgi:hypothetical protein
LAGLFAQLEPDRSSGLLLSNRRAIRGISVCSDVLDPDCDDVTATELAVDCQIEHGKVASAAFNLEFCPDRPDVFRDASGNEQPLRSGSTGQYRQAGQGGSRDRDARRRCRSRLLQQPRDPCVPRGRHHGNSAQAADVAKSDGRFGKQDFVYLPEEDAYRCPAGKQLPYRFTSEEDGKRLRRYWTTACQDCSLKSQCTTAPERRIPRWQHEHLLETVQQRLDANPQAMRQRRETVEHPFGTMKARMGATHFLTKTLPKVAAEMALSVLAYNLTRVMNVIGPKPLMAAIAA